MKLLCDMDFLIKLVAPVATSIECFSMTMRANALQKDDEGAEQHICQSSLGLASI
jgi:hypothetical protein